MILFDGALYGPYRTKSQAINNAIDTAQLGKGKSQVFVARDETCGIFELLWTFGVDQYPPPRPARRNNDA